MLHLQLLMLSGLLRSGRLASSSDIALSYVPMAMKHTALSSAILVNSENTELDCETTLWSHGK